MDIRTLENIELDQLVNTFNQSFADYDVPLQLTTEQLQEKIVVEGINHSISVGAFDDGKLVGFVLHGYDIIDGQKTIYNAATGVIPEKRGQKLTKQLYDFILPELEKQKIKRCILEVIEGNQPAIKTYQAIGFTVSRKLDCFKGSVAPGISKNGREIRELDDLDRMQLRSFWDWTPTWQNSSAVIEKTSGKILAIGWRQDGQLLGYAVYNPTSGQVLQFAVSKKHRRQGIATKLFKHISADVHKKISIINIDNRSNETVSFLQSIGLKCFIKQFELELKINTTATGTP